jgi:hypothetical protein
VASLAKTGALPSGVSFVDNGDGTATIAGTPAAGSDGSYPITITAANGIAPNATQNFILTINGTAPTPTRLLNISTRLLTGSGENVAIGGFIVTGDGSKTVLIRGLGPSLSAFFTNPLQDPALELHQESLVIASNDDWQDTPNLAQLPSGFEPADSREAIIIETLSAGPYTVIQSSKDIAGGIGLLEIYDLDSTGETALANISTRGLVQTGNEIMIGGFILGGETEQSTVVVRAIGPSLTSFGISNALADPTLELHDGDGSLIRDNDNWKDVPAQADDLMARGFAPGNDLEPAIVATLPPGPYTAIVAGKGGGIGVALVEVYHVP